MVSAFLSPFCPGIVSGHAGLVTGFHYWISLLDFITGHSRYRVFPSLGFWAFFRNGS